MMTMVWITLETREGWEAGRSDVTIRESEENKKIQTRKKNEDEKEKWRREDEKDDENDKKDDYTLISDKDGEVKKKESEKENEYQVTPQQE